MSVEMGSKVKELPNHQKKQLVEIHRLNRFLLCNLCHINLKKLLREY